jgi:hypothetical protein
MVSDQAYDCYTERAHLLAVLSRIYPAHLFVPSDKEEGFSYALCIHFPWGQGTWHLDDADTFGLFQPLLPAKPSDYDGHTTTQKYTAMARAVHEWEPWEFPDYPPVLP